MSAPLLSKDIYFLYDSANKKMCMLISHNIIYYLFAMFK